MLSRATPEIATATRAKSWRGNNRQRYMYPDSLRDRAVFDVNIGEYWWKGRGTAQKRVTGGRWRTVVLGVLLAGRVRLL